MWLIKYHSERPFQNIFKLNIVIRIMPYIVMSVTCRYNPDVLMFQYYLYIVLNIRLFFLLCYAVTRCFDLYIYIFLICKSYSSIINACTAYKILIDTVFYFSFYNVVCLFYSITVFIWSFI